MKFFGIFFIAMLFTASFSLATEDFATTSKEIVDQLCKVPQKKEKTRSLITRSIQPQPQRRGIIIREKDPVSEGEQSISETVVIPHKNLQPHVNLKIEFDFDSYAIRPNSYPLLAELAHALQTGILRESRFAIIGHTDSDGDERYNLNLSYKRALSVKKLLRDTFGISGKKLTVFGYGENMPIANNTTEQGKQKNRRVEIVRLEAM